MSESPKDKSSGLKEEVTFYHPDFGDLSIEDFLQNVGDIAVAVVECAHHLGHKHHLGTLKSYMDPKACETIGRQAALSFLKDFIENDTKRMLKKWLPGVNPKAKSTR